MLQFNQFCNLHLVEMNEMLFLINNSSDTVGSA